MSGRLNLTAEQLRKLGNALDAMTEITRTHGVTFTPYSRLEVGLDDNVLYVAWNEAAEAYVIDDRNGE